MTEKDFTHCYLKLSVSAVETFVLFSRACLCLFFFVWSLPGHRPCSQWTEKLPSLQKKTSVLDETTKKRQQNTWTKHMQEHHHDRLDATFRRNIAIRSAGGDTAGTCCGRVHRVKEGYDGRTRSGQQSTAMPKRDTGHGCLKPVVIVGHHSAVCETGGALHEDLKGLT